MIHVCSLTRLHATDDETGPPALMTFELVTDREPSLLAARLQAGPTLDYGAFLGLDLPGGFYDAGDFDTLSFFARADPPFTLSVSLLDTLFEQYQASIDLGTDWQLVELPLASFERDGVTLDRSRVTHLQFWARGPGPAFELWIDEVRLSVDD